MEHDSNGKRRYNEWVTSDGAWEMQVRQPAHILMHLASVANYLQGKASTRSDPTRCHLIVR